MNQKSNKDEGKQKHPVLIPDRRLRARSRPNASDRRKMPRFAVDFPVQIIIGSGDQAQTIEARATDISDGGLCLENVILPSDQERLKLRFRLPEGTMPEGYDPHDFELDATVRITDNEKKSAGIQFDEPLSSRLARTTWNYMLWGAIITLFLTVSLVLLTKYQSLYYFWFDVPVFLYSLTVGAYLVTRFLFASFYRPPKAAGKTPPLSLLIPAHNEQKHIEQTISHVFESDYPIDKLQVIAINDGSEDKTLEAMMRAKEKYPDLVIINFEEQQGKRQALAAGTRVATGEIIVFTDSDSFLRHDALTKIVDGFENPKVAAVTGHCDVSNAWANMLTKMQAIRYFIGFRIMKGAESVFDVVTCLSGPLSAYRRESLLEILDAWVNQKVFGQPATYGDDRSLTNMLMRKGWYLRYDSRARTTTMVPERHRIFLRQQLRWKRSWFRESLKACFFIWKRQPLMSISFYVGFILPILAPAVVLRAVFYVPLFQNGTPIMYLFGILLMSAFISTSYLFARRSRLWMYGVVFCFYYLFILVWQMPYAILTFWKSKWGTRHSIYNDSETG